MLWLFILLGCTARLESAEHWGHAPAQRLEKQEWEQSHQQSRSAEQPPLFPRGRQPGCAHPCPMAVPTACQGTGRAQGLSSVFHRGPRLLPRPVGELKVLSPIAEFGCSVSSGPCSLHPRRGREPQRSGDGEATRVPGEVPASGLQNRCHCWHKPCGAKPSTSCPPVSSHPGAQPWGQHCRGLPPLCLGSPLPG